jgi:hypothetical protein
MHDRAAFTHATSPLSAMMMRGLMLRATSCLLCSVSWISLLLLVTHRLNTRLPSLNGH